LTVVIDILLLLSVAICVAVGIVIGRRRPRIEKLLIGVLMALFFGGALYLRVALPYDTVFGGSWVKFTGVDGYYHVRIIESLVRHFPHLNSFDPYMLYPGGMDMGISTHYPFFDYLVAGVAWIIGLGSPSQHTVEVVCAYFPAVLGALMVVPVYFIGRTLANRWAGVVAAGLIATSPGDFLGRSILGFTDHHMAETLFAAVAVMFLVMAVKNAKREPLTLSQLKHPNREGAAKPLIYAALAGLFLGIYLITWMGALLFVLIFTAFLVVQFVADHLRGKPTDYLCLTGTTMFLVAFVIRLIVPFHDRDVVALLIALLVPPLLLAISRLMASRSLKPVYYPLALVVLALGALGLFWAVDRSLFNSMRGYFDIFVWQSDSTISEMQPLLMSGGDLSLKVVWQSYRFSLIIAIGAFGLLGYWVVKRGESEGLLVMLWTLVILAAALAQRRFTYYFSVNIAVLAGCGTWEVLKYAGVGEGPVQNDVKTGVAKKKATKKRHEKPPFRLERRYVYTAVAAIAIFSLLYFPTIGTARRTARGAPYAPSDAWCESLTWLRETAPEPFGDADFYYAKYDTPFDHADYPDAYGVTSWWDYGYWIVRIGHRVPTLNPSGQPKIIPKVSELLLTQDEASAAQMCEDMGSGFVVVDYLMALVYLDSSSGILGGKFAPMVSYSDHEDSEFFDIFFAKNEASGNWEPVLYYLPGFYRSLCVRLFWFGGEAAEPDEYKVVLYKEQLSEGSVFKLVQSVKTYATYEEALAASRVTGEVKGCIVSDDPSASAVPLEKLQHYRSVHDAGQYLFGRPEVRIFQYVE
jgi:oligosaccharyl transferase (archaeosortase A-associated)